MVPDQVEQLHPVGDTEFRINPLYVRLHGVDGNEQHFADVAVCLPLDDKPDDLPFPFGQPALFKKCFSVPRVAAGNISLEIVPADKNVYEHREKRITYVPEFEKLLPEIDQIQGKEEEKGHKSYNDYKEKAPFFLPLDFSQMKKGDDGMNDKENVSPGKIVDECK